MIHPKLTKKTLEGLLDIYDVEIVKKDSGFYIYSLDDFFSESFFADLVQICTVFGYDFYVATKANGTLFIDLF
jgi:hypothetical protein